MASHNGKPKCIVDPDPAGLDEVIRRERRAIARRRERALGVLPGREEATGPCGLALSGGGIRSAALSLGFLEALRQGDQPKSSLMTFVDYLSTVSGGGYAGAYFSSQALARAEGDEASDLHAAATDSVNGHAESVNDHSHPSLNADSAINGISADGELDVQTLKFVYGGNYLRKTWLFFNRYLIGLSLVWVTLLSGLLATAAAAALLFRCLDYPIVRTAIAALDFDGDVWLAFFPSFVLLVAWFIAWTISYLKYTSRTTGTVARWLFFLLVLVTATAVAALIGAGDIGLPDSIGGTGNALGKTILMMIISGVAASLLPYLAPKRLLRSGTAPKNVAEKYTFWIATRAMVYGLPFVAVALLAREDISGWNERRDDRLTRTDTDFSAANPIFRELLVDEKSTVSPSDFVWAATCLSPFSPPLYASLSNLYGTIWSKEHYPHSIGRIWPTGNPTAKDLMTSLVEASNAGAIAETDMDDWGHVKKEKTSTTANLESPLNDLGKDTLKSSDPDPIAPSYDHVAAGRTLRESVTSFFDRWLHFAAFLVHSAALDNQAAKDGQFYVDWMAKFRPLQLQDRLAHQINKRLKDPAFYKSFWPNEDLGSATGGIPSISNDSDLYHEFRVAYQPPAAADSLAAAASAAKFDERFTRWRDNLNQLAAEAKEIEVQVANTAKSVHAEKFSPPEVAKDVAVDANDRAVFNINRRLLSAYYGDHIKSPSVIYSANVLYEDQRTRLHWFLWCAGLFLVASLCMDLNATSLHGFYSTQLGHTWIVPSSTDRCKIPLAELRTTELGKPYQLINGTVQLFGAGTGKMPLQQENFLFSRYYCGCDSLKYAPTSRYMNGLYGLDDAIAVSGAAISPALSHNPLVLVLLALANMRLGQWVDNPSSPARQSLEATSATSHWPITPMRAIINLFRPPSQRRMCFVTDGGHYENLGIEPLLLRRCKLIIALDAGQDADFSFADFSRLVRRMRMKYGISIVSMDDPADQNENDAPPPLRLDSLTPPGGTAQDAQFCKDSPKAANTKNVDGRREMEEGLERRLSKEHYAVLRIKYPEADGYLIYAKSTLTGDEPFDLINFAKEDKCFPHDETADQFFAPDRFESYRQLGFHIGEQVYKHFQPRLSAAVEAHSAAPLVQLRATHQTQRPNNGAQTEEVAASNINDEDQVTGIEQLLSKKPK